MRANEFVKKFGWDAAKYKADELKIFKGLGGELSIEDAHLIRLVESHELVESFGSVSQAKFWVDMMDGSDSMQKRIDRVKQAILDVESCNENQN